MAYSYDYIREYNEQFVKEHKREIRRLTEDEQQAMNYVMYGADQRFESSSSYYVEIKKQKIEVLSEFVKKEYGNVADLLVPAEFIPDFYRACDDMVRFQYARSYWRRSYRSLDAFSHAQRIFELMNMYYLIGRFGLKPGGLKPVVCDEWDDNKNRSIYLSLNMTDLFIAERVNAGDEEVTCLLKDMITSENNTNVLTYRAIRSVLRSDDAELHSLLCGLLVAARLQEGLRQAICENADCGTAEAFIMLLHTIKHHNLIRFSAVKRAVATWCGICWEGDPDRASEKILDDMLYSLESRENCMELIHTTDAVHIYCGLWGLSFYDIEDAVSVIRTLVGLDSKCGEEGVSAASEDGNGNELQLLTIGYFLRGVELEGITYPLASAVIEANPANHKIFAMFCPMYVYYVYDNRHAFSKIDGYAKEIFADREAARRHYGILQGLCDSLPKKKIEYDPMLFPWFSERVSKSRILQCMLGAAVVMDDEEKLKEIGMRLPDFDAEVRSSVIDMIGSRIEKADVSKANGEKMHDSKMNTVNTALRSIVVNAVADKETYTRRSAVRILKELVPTEEEYRVIEGFAKYKAAEVRQGVLELLKMRPVGELETSVLRMLSSKEENVRLAALDLLMYAKNEYKDADLTKPAAAAASIEMPTDREKILIREITGNPEAEERTAKNGYGLYDVHTSIAPAQGRPNIKLVRKFFSVPHRELAQMERDLMALIDENADLEFTDYNGEERRLGNFGSLPCKWSSVRKERESQKVFEVTPFHELWAAYYRDSIKTPDRFWSLYLYHKRNWFHDSFAKESQKYYDRTQKEIFGTIADFDYAKELGVKDKRFLEHSYDQLRGCVYESILSEMEPEIPLEVLQNCVLYMARNLPMEALILMPDPDDAKRGYYWAVQPTLYLSGLQPVQIKSQLTGCLNREFETNFRILHELLVKQHEIRCELKRRDFRQFGSLPIGIPVYISALIRGIITEDDIYKVMFEYVGLPDSIAALSMAVYGTITYYERETYQSILAFEGKQMTDSYAVPADSRLYQVMRELLISITELVVGTELRRGDSETDFSRAALSIKKIFGMDRLMEILTALGNEALKANSYYISSISKRDSLGHLLRSCYPDEGDTAAQLTARVKQAHISDERLIEAAMFAPQWIPLVGEHLGIEGFKSGCYYFMAHTADTISAQRLAVIAKFTPFSKEELNGGCFDAKWFQEVYEQLGSKIFDRLYKSAKYISQSNLHTRARKFADAALGKLEIADVEETILDKRNKDLLLALAIIPSKGRADILQRYEFIQAFLKQSRQFGAQRRQSEGEAVKYALKNLAQTAGYSDDTRLTLSMETELVTQNRQYLEPVTMDEYTMQLVIDRAGKASISFEKKGKALKSVPAAFKKNETYLSVKEFCDKLKAQYSRTVKMFELAMEERSVFTLGELARLRENPVTAAIMESLVFVTAENSVKGSGTDKRCVEIVEKECETGRSDAGIVDKGSETDKSSAGGAEKESRIITNNDGFVEKGSETDKSSMGFVEKEGGKHGTEFVNKESGKNNSIAGFIAQDGLTDEKGIHHSLPEDTGLRIAHPYDLYQSGAWSGFQAALLERGSGEGKLQPFRQVFRELYVKLPEEREKTMSLMFAGYQIQAQRTVATLKTRRWVADYEDGLQKIYYDDNIIASIYAVADWFSPADIEAPVIEGVCFYDRKTGRQLTVGEIPDIIYSEVMRDVDLAVSVAHAGGVDPETSHSTIEMRSVIVEYNMKLFGIRNAVIDKNHIVIDGKWGRYSIHLGSGVIHMEGGHQIQVVAVSSGKKSKIFLPFLDEDPKTAEIVSKLILFANDGKIKDPFIMEQIRGIPDMA